MTNHIQFVLGDIAFEQWFESGTVAAARPADVDVEGLACRHTPLEICRSQTAEVEINVAVSILIVFGVFRRQLGGNLRFVELRLPFAVAPAGSQSKNGSG